MPIKFVVDSMCDSSDLILNRNTVDVLPIPIILDSKTYYDKIDITAEMILDYVNHHKTNFPKTAQVTPAHYKKCFEEHLRGGYDIIYIALGSGISGTFQTAKLIASELLKTYPDRKIAVIDSKCATTGMAMILHQGIKLNQLDKSFEEITETLTFLSEHIQVFFMVGDIKWLGKGGRVSKSIALLGDMLKIVPILHFVDGKILAYDKVRGKKKALKTLFKAYEKYSINAPSQIIGVINSTADDLQKRAIAHFEKEYHCPNIIVPEAGAGAALTVHIGPDCLGIMFFDALPDNYVHVYP